MWRALCTALLHIVCVRGAACPQWGGWQVRTASVPRVPGGRARRDVLWPAQPWSPCVWGTFDQCRWAVFDAIGFRLDAAPAFPTAVCKECPAVPPCGRCPWRIRARKRPLGQGCSCVGVQSAQCEGHTAVCSYSTGGEVFGAPAAAKLGCSSIGLAKYYLRQCSSQASTADWLRHVNNDVWDAVPAINCAETAGGKCACCCGQWTPSADGSQCVPAPMAGEQCEEWGPFNDWSDECVWFDAPPRDMATSVGRHCAIGAGDIEDPILAALLLLPPVAEAPARCGYCSFRAKCRRRPAFSTGGRRACFPLDVEKRACGPADCGEACGRPCALPKVSGGCDYTDMILKAAPAHVGRIGALPTDVKEGLLKLLTNMPFGKCVELGGECKCCCHPYEPTADGLSCRLADACTWPAPGEVDPTAELGLPPKLEL